MFVGFGGSSGTGLYLSGCTTPGGDKSREGTPTYPSLHLPTGPLNLHAACLTLEPPQPPELKVGVACSPSTLTANAFGVTDLPAADGIVVLLVAHQCVHAQDGW